MERSPGDSPEASRPRQRPRWKQTSDFVCVGLLTLVVAASRFGLWSLESDSLLAWLSAVGSNLHFYVGFVFLPAFGWLAARRQWWLAASGIPLLALCFVPTLAQFSPRERADVGAETLKVVTLNLLLGSESTSSVLDEVLEADPDVVVLQEYSRAWHEVCLQSELAARYPHRYTLFHEPGYFGVACYSKRPFASPPQRVSLAGGDVPQLRCELELDGRPIAIYGLHLVPPRNVHWSYHRTQVLDLRSRLASEPLPVVVAGDFNFDTHCPQARALTGLGLQDTLETAGWGRETTWPIDPDRWWVPSMRLDHIYLRGLVARSSRTGSGEGSDHRPVFAEIGFAR